MIMEVTPVAATASVSPGGAATSLDRSHASQCVDFLLTIGALKTNKRTGWVRSGVALPESIADHMYRMAVAALLIHDAGVDSAKACRIALAHDIAEAIVGDITPHDGVPKDVKSRMERDAMERLRGLLGDNPAGQLLYDSWAEYEAGLSPEAKVVKDIDKLEMILQAFEYERDQAPLQLSDFYDSVRGKWRTRTVQMWAHEVLQRRVQMHAERIGFAVGASKPDAVAPSPQQSDGGTSASAALAPFAAGFAAGIGVALIAAIITWHRVNR